jgi:3-phenylpropionate/trans-cinnamate dioxygenase ferredoxin component
VSQWHLAAEEAEFLETDRKLVDLGGHHQIGLFRRPDGYYAISAWCSHQKATMIHGEVEDHALECPLHGARFDLRTGRNLCLPAVRPVPRYEVKVENGRIYIKA